MSDQDATADVFVRFVVLMSSAAEPFKALRTLGCAARSLQFRRELTPERRQRLRDQAENVKRAARAGRN